MEKDAVFQRLTQDRLFDSVPCIIVTAKGMPDLATRALCHRIASVATYKHGGLRSGDGDEFLIPNLKWLGLRSAAVREIRSEVFEGPGGRSEGEGVRIGQPLPCTSELTRRDRSLASGLMTRLTRLGETRWCEELACMTEEGWKSDLESLYSSAGGMGGMAHSLAQSIIRGDYI